MREAGAKLDITIRILLRQYYSAIIVAFNGTINKKESDNQLKT